MSPCQVVRKYLNTLQINSPFESDPIHKAPLFTLSEVKNKWHKLGMLLLSGNREKIININISSFPLDRSWY